MKFHKLVSLFLAFFLLLSNIGLAVNVHYCGGEIASVSFNTISNSNTAEDSCCGVLEQESHCCKDKVVYFQKKTQQATVFTFQLENVGIFVVEQWQAILSKFSVFTECNSVTKYAFQSHAPPLFKLYSQYIFYDRF